MTALFERAHCRLREASFKRQPAGVGGARVERARRVVIIEFPTMDAARGFYDSPEYQEAKKIRTPISEAQFVVVQGVE